MTLPNNHAISDVGHTADHNAIASQVNTNTTDIAARITTAAATAAYLTATNAIGHGAVGDGVTNDWAALQATLSAAAGKPFAFIPAGTYSINASLTLPYNTSLILDPGAVIRADAVIAGPMLTVGDLTNFWRDQKVQGGVWKCNANAQNAVSVLMGQNSLVDTTWYDPTSHGVILGSLSAAQASTSMRCTGKGDKAVSVAKVAGSYGVWLRSCNDSKIDVTIVGADRSVRADGGNNTITVHGYGLGASQVQDPTAVCSDNGSDNVWLNCECDAPSSYGWELTASAFRPRIIGGHVFVTTASLDNTVIGIHNAQALPNQSLTIEGVTFTGPDGSHRLAKDYDGTYPSALVSSSNNYSDSTTVVTRVLDKTSQPTVQVNRLAGYGSAPTSQVGAGQGTSPPANVVVAGSTDTRGGITFGTGTATASDLLLFVTFATAYAAAPVVLLIPRNFSAGGLGLFVRATSTTSFTVGCTATPAINAPNTAYAFDYIVIG